MVGQPPHPLLLAFQIPLEPAWIICMLNQPSEHFLSLEFFCVQFTAQKLLFFPSQALFRGLFFKETQNRITKFLGTLKHPLYQDFINKHFTHKFPNPLQTTQEEKKKTSTVDTHGELLLNQHPTGCLMINYISLLKYSLQPCLAITSCFRALLGSNSEGKPIYNLSSINKNNISNETSYPQQIFIQSMEVTPWGQTLHINISTEHPSQCSICF